ncbi:hypothetical protein AAA799P11_00729 [Marine Group I thaumarchaeote SCGC AAA799-P11]|uniref:Uncharacterized protein n=1 Tax=Marine Group I thaumarchaeote SCGC AAA799-P11 TaxID=1502295 RepID=A0A087S1C4_9ARCH|nr:hypothetical protein AAA799P11_00729 [Marine Group I thaumarchaeote SCGC AAA799-P11]
MLSQLERLKDEFDVLKEQYKILGEELSEILNFSIAQTNIKLASESEKTQKSLKKQGKLSFISSIAIIGLTIVLLGITLQQFSIDNAEPDFLVNRGHINVIHANTFDQVEYLSPILLSTSTSHNFKYNVVLTEDSVEKYDFGNCFFKETPKVNYAEPLVFFLSSGVDERELDPKFRLSYETQMPKFSEKALERSVLHSIGEIEFKIIAQDAQGDNESIVIPAKADLSMRIPWNYNTTAICY